MKVTPSIFVTFTDFCIKGSLTVFELKGFKVVGIHFRIMWKNLCSYGFDRVCSQWYLMKNLTSDTRFEDNTSQNDHLSRYITVSSILLCPALYCVQHIIVSSKILCPHLHKLSFVHLSCTFYRVAVASCCTCEAPEYKISPKYMQWSPSICLILF